MVYRPQFYQLQELVCKDIYDRFGDRAWQFLDDRAVVTLDWIRRTLGKPVTVNNWYDGGEFDQRGLRCILCPLVKDKCLKGELYASAHIFGRAFDFNVENMDSAEVSIWIAYNKDKLPYNLRIERDTVGWTHIDTLDNGNKLTFFNP
jgi:hypothetical protein